MNQPSTGTVRPLSADMIMQVLRTNGHEFTVDGDGDIYGDWEYARIYFFQMGEQREILNIRAYVSCDFPMEAIGNLYAFCNDWNRDKLWPKAYVHVCDSGKACIVGEVVTDLEFGVTPEQLGQLMKCAVSSSCALAEDLMSRDYPFAEWEDDD